MIMSVALILVLAKVTSTFSFYSFNCGGLGGDNCKTILTSIFASTTILFIFLGAMYTIIYAHSMLGIPFKASYFLMVVTFIIFPLLISIYLINYFPNTDIATFDREKYLRSFFSKGMMFLNLCFIFLNLYLLGVFKAERKYFGKDFSTQSTVLLIFHGAGIFFTNMIVFCVSKILTDLNDPHWVNTLFIFLIFALAASILYLFMAIAFEMKIKFMIGKNKR